MYNAYVENDNLGEKCNKCHEIDVSMQKLNEPKYTAGFIFFEHNIFPFSFSIQKLHENEAI